MQSFAGADVAFGLPVVGYAADYPSCSVTSPVLPCQHLAILHDAAVAAVGVHGRGRSFLPVDCSSSCSTTGAS